MQLDTANLSRCFMSRCFPSTLAYHVLQCGVAADRRNRGRAVFSRGAGVRIGDGIVFSASTRSCFTIIGFAWC